MTPRRYLKKQISLQKHYLRHLPPLIDCSEVYGDGCFTQEDVVKAENRIQELQQILDKMEKPN